MGTISQTKISRKQLMHLYDMSKSTVLKLESQGKITPYFYDDARRKAYYDVRQIERIFQPVVA